MEFIIDFYKSLDTLNLIIFWGIIIVIILLLIFAFILMNKNKKLKSLVEKNNKNEEELPIKKEELAKENNKEKNENKEYVENLETEIKTEDTVTLPSIPEISKKNEQESETMPKTLEKEKKFIAEEHVMEYNNDLFSLSNIKKTNEQLTEKNKYDIKTKTEIEMPTGPYQRNVLREMSLGQTSPIGITTRVNKEEKKMQMVKDLEESLNNEQNENITDKITQIQNQKEESKKEYQKEEIKNEMEKVNIQIKKELSNIKNTSPRKTEIKIETPEKNTINYEKTKTEQIISSKPTYQVTKEEKNIKQAEIKPIIEKTTNMTHGQLSAKELLDRQPIMPEEKVRKTASEKYLEEVSRKLAEAEIPDEIERTDYELEQEENAIISYKELMEKKDSIQTIDEEEAVISIEELMNRNNQTQEEIKDDTKLYKLTEEEENDDFINELKQFRNDL